MSLAEILNSDANISITIKANDLKEFFNSMVDEKFQSEKSNQSEKHWSVDETCANLNVVRSTLWTWEKKGYLMPVRVGKKLMYKQSDIDKLMNGGLEA